MAIDNLKLDIETLLGNYSANEQKQIVAALLRGLYGTKPTITINCDYGLIQPVVLNVTNDEHPTLME